MTKDNIPVAESKLSAMTMFNSGHKTIRCVKVKRTAQHCPNHKQEQVCTTEKQILTFYTGKPKWDE